MTLRRLLSAVAIASSLSAAAALPATESHTVGAQLRPVWVIPTNSFLRHSSLKAAVEPHLRYSFTFAEGTRLRRWCPTAYQGIGLAASPMLPKSPLGTPVSIYLFQGARLAKISDRVELKGEWNFGISFPWKKQGADVDDAMMGSAVNARLGVALMLAWQITDNWALSAGIDAAHFSDGNSRLPNGGLNLFGGNIGLSYTIGAKKGATEHPVSAAADFTPGMGYDLLVYGAPVQRAITDDSDEKYFLPRTFGVGGICFAPMYAFNPLLRAGASVDIQYDDSANLDPHRVPGTWGDDIKFYRQPLRERLSAGLSLHAELTMPIFSINLGLGRYVIAKGRDTSVFYQTLALKIHVAAGAFVNIGYQLRNFHRPNNLMLGVGYTVGRR